MREQTDLFFFLTEASAYANTATADRQRAQSKKNPQNPVNPVKKGINISVLFRVFRGQKELTAQSPESASMASASLWRWASIRRGSLVKVVMVDVISDGTIKSS